MHFEAGADDVGAKTIFDWTLQGIGRLYPDLSTVGLKTPARHHKYNPRLLSPGRELFDAVLSIPCCTPVLDGESPPSIRQEQ